MVLHIDRCWYLSNTLNCVSFLATSCSTKLVKVSFYSFIASFCFLMSRSCVWSSWFCILSLVTSPLSWSICDWLLAFALSHLSSKSHNCLWLRKLHLYKITFALNYVFQFFFHWVTHIMIKEFKDVILVNSSLVFLHQSLQLICLSGSLFS